MVSIKKETFNYFIGTALLALLNFIVSILYGDMFSPEDYGEYSLVFATYSLLSQIVVGWVSSSLIRYYAAHKKENRTEKLIGSIFIQHIVFSVLEFVLVILSLQFVQLPENTEAMIIVFSIFFLFETYVLFMNTLMRVTNNSKQYNINTNLNIILKIVALFALYYLAGVKSVLAIALSLLIAEVIQSVYLTIKFRMTRYFSPKNFDRKVLLQLFKYGVPLIGVSATNWILNVSDRYVIEYFYSSHEVGLYSYSYNIASSVISLVTQFLLLGAYPNIIKAWEDDGKQKAIKMIKEYLTIYMLIVVPFCLGIMCVGKQFFEAFTNERYWGGYVNFIITGFGIAVLGLTAYTNKVWELKKKTIATLLLSLVAALSNIALNIWLIPKYGYVFGSVTTLISYVIYLVLSVLFSRRYMKLEVDWSRIGRIIFSGVCMVGVVSVMNLFPPLNNAIGFVIKVVTGAIVYVVLIVLTKVFKPSYIKDMLVNRV